MTRTPPAKTIVHLISGFLGAGKTTLIKNLMAQKDPAEQWVIIVNEFGEIGIDGAVLSDNGIPVAEVAGGCLCCTAGPVMGATLVKMLRQYRPDRLLIEASGLAHAASVIDELRRAPLAEAVTVGAVLTVIDPRRFVDPAWARQALFADQISVADVLVAAKTESCDAGTLNAFAEGTQKLFPPKAKIVTARADSADISWLDTPPVAKSRYRVATLPDNTLGYQSEGFVFPENAHFDGERLTRFYNRLPELAQGLIRAKGVFQVEGSWVWLNWADGQWGATETSWRRDNRFELIAQAFDPAQIEAQLKEALA